MEPIKINLTTKLSGVKELTVKSIIERDNELVIELYNDESYFIKEGTKLCFVRHIYIDGPTHETITEYVDVLYKDDENKIHTTTIAPKKVQLFNGGDFIKKKTWTNEDGELCEVFYISSKELHNIYPQDILLGEPEFVIKNYSGIELATFTKEFVKIPNEYGDGYITSADCVSLIEEIESCGKRYDSVKKYVYNFFPNIVSKNSLIISGITEDVLNDMSYMEIRQNRFYYSYVELDENDNVKEYDNFGKPVKKCRLYTDPWWPLYENITKSREGKIYVNEGSTNSILCYNVDYWATNIGLSSPVNESTLGSSDNFSTKFVEDLEDSLIPEVIDMERVKYSPMTYDSGKSNVYFKLTSNNDREFPVVYTKEWINVANGLNNGDVVENVYILNDEGFSKIDVGNSKFMFNAYSLVGGNLYREEIDSFDNSVTTYTYYPTEEVVNDALSIATSITISMHFRKRHMVDHSTPSFNTNTNLTSGNVYTDGWFISEEDNLITWWNGFVCDDEKFNIRKFNKFIEESGTTSDLIGYLNFTDSDIFYRKKKVSQSFLRFSFYNSNDPIEQKLLFYSTSFLDSTTLYGKYIKQMMFMEENDLFNEKKNEGINLNAAVVMCSADTVSARVDTKVVLTNEYDRTKSSEGFNIYLFSDDKNLNLENSEKTIYMKVEFNHAGNGKTIPLIMWPKDKNGVYTALTVDNFIENLYIPIKLTYIDGKYVYYIPGAKNNDNGNIDLILFEPKLDIIEDVDGNGNLINPYQRT